MKKEKGVYPIKFTEAATQRIVQVGSLEDAEKVIRKSIARVEAEMDDDQNAFDLLFHTVVYPPGSRKEAGRYFFCSPETLDDGFKYIQVDVAVYEDMGPIDKGPLAGKTISIPRPTTPPRKR